MKQTVNQYDFEQAFRSAGRGEQFSYKALRALFEHLEEYEESTGEEIELDVVALCCDFCEYSSAKEAAAAYGHEPDADQDEDEQEAAALEYLRDNTTVIEFDGGVVIQNF